MQTSAIANAKKCNCECKQKCNCKCKNIAIANAKQMQLIANAKQVQLQMQKLGWESEPSFFEGVCKKRAIANAKQIQLQMQKMQLQMQKLGCESEPRVLRCFSFWWMVDVRVGWLLTGWLFRFRWCVLNNSGLSLPFCPFRLSLPFCSICFCSGELVGC